MRQWCLLVKRRSRGLRLRRINSLHWIVRVCSRLVHEVVEVTKLLVRLYLCARHMSSDALYQIFSSWSILLFHTISFHSSYKIHQLFTDYLLRLPSSELLEKHLFRSRANRRLVSTYVEIQKISKNAEQELASGEHGLRSHSFWTCSIRCDDGPGKSTNDMQKLWMAPLSFLQWGT